ncbi:MBL fold metallo-hydrolase [Tardisphaera miroshnichenkoae]
MIQELRLTVLNDNEPSEGLLNGWGWSLLVESEKWRFLFDSGPEARILSENSKRLGVDLGRLNFAFLSHDHWDHRGGLAYVESLNPGITVYVPARGGAHVPKGLRAQEVTEESLLAEDVWSTGTFSSAVINEHSAVVLTKAGYVLLVGCSHPGIGNIARLVKKRHGGIFFVIGGFHEPSDDQLKEAIEDCTYLAPAHCSGDRAKQEVMRLRSRYVSVKTGTRLVIKDRVEAL